MAFIIWTLRPLLFYLHSISNFSVQWIFQISSYFSACCVFFFTFLLLPVRRLKSFCMLAALLYVYIIIIDTVYLCIMPNQTQTHDREKNLKNQNQTKIIKRKFKRKKNAIDTTAAKKVLVLMEIKNKIQPTNNI